MQTRTKRALPLLALWCLILAGARQCVAAYEPLRKVVIETPKQAVCLDGTPAAVFVRPADPAKWVIFFQGGDQCTVRERKDSSARSRAARAVARWSPAAGAHLSKPPHACGPHPPSPLSLRPNAPGYSHCTQTRDSCLAQMELDLLDRDVLQL